MIGGTGVIINKRTGERVGAVHVGDGKLRGAPYWVPDPTRENPHRKKRVTAREAHQKLMALDANITAVGADDPSLDEPEPEAEVEPAEPDMIIERDFPATDPAEDEEIADGTDATT